MAIACKKYPEDDRRTLRSPVNRIAGKWKVEELLINKVDFTDTVFRYHVSDNGFVNSLNQQYVYRGLTVEFQKTGNSLYEPGAIAKVVSRESSEGYYRFEYQRKLLHLSVAPHPRASSNWYFNNKFTINKLTREEMILTDGVRKLALLKAD